MHQVFRKKKTKNKKTARKEESKTCEGKRNSVDYGDIFMLLHLFLHCLFVCLFLFAVLVEIIFPVAVEL